MPSAAAFDSIGIGLPPEWATLPIEQRDFDRLCADVRQRWRQEPGWDRTTERRAELLLARVRAEVRRANIRMAAMYMEPGGGDANDTLMAACTFATYTQRELDTTLPLTYSNLLAAYSVRPKATSEESHDVRRITNLEPPCRHQLRVGRSIRLRRLYELRQPVEGTQRLFGESFVMPIGDDATTCGALQFVTPNLTLATGFSALFVAIAETVMLYTPDQETEIATIRPDV